MYQLHPSLTLQKLFKDKPYQGCCPIQAKYLFIGLDANYAEDIEQQPIFPKLLEYHQDGVAFWKKYGVHHPFLMSGYQGDGRKYHQVFAKIGLTSDDAEKISFVELLDLPTVGLNTLKQTDLTQAHLDYLQQAIFSQHKKAVFMSDGVYRLMKKTNNFQWLKQAKTIEAYPLDLYFNDKVKIFKQKHFSYRYAKAGVMEQQAQAIGYLIQSDS